MNKRIVLSLGGSLIVPDKINVELLKNFRELILEKIEDGYEFVIFTGGGSVARTYIEGAQAVTDMTNEQLDWLGIQATHLNAKLVRELFGKVASDEIIVDPTEERELTHPVTIGGGWKPGWSTDYDAVEIAVKHGFDTVVNLSNIEYAYDKDPNKFDDAVKIEQSTWAEFRKVVGDEWVPGLNAPFDPIAAKLCEEHNIRVIIANGNDIDNVRAIIEGGEYKGTTVQD